MTVYLPSLFDIHYSIFEIRFSIKSESRGLILNQNDLFLVAGGAEGEIRFIGEPKKKFTKAPSTIVPTYGAGERAKTRKED